MSKNEAGSTGQQDSTTAVAETVSEQTRKVKERGREELRDQLDQRTSDVGRQARSLAEALRRAGCEARPAANGTRVERVTSGVAERLEQAGSYLEQTRGEEMLRDAERFVRTRPWLVAGAAAAAGFAVTRSSGRPRSTGTTVSTSRGSNGSQDWRARPTIRYETREPAQTPEPTAVVRWPGCRRRDGRTA